MVSLIRSHQFGHFSWSKLLLLMWNFKIGTWCISLHFLFRSVQISTSICLSETSISSLDLEIFASIQFIIKIKFRSKSAKPYQEWRSFCRESRLAFIVIWIHLEQYKFNKFIISRLAVVITICSKWYFYNRNHKHCAAHAHSIQCHSFSQSVPKTGHHQSSIYD